MLRAVELRAREQTPDCPVRTVSRVMGHRRSFEKIRDPLRSVVVQHPAPQSVQVVVDALDIPLMVGAGAEPALLPFRYAARP